MMFTKHRSVVSNNKAIPMTTNTINMSMMPARHPNAIDNKQTTIPTPSTQKVGLTRGRSVWGPATWSFFHTSAAKLRPEFFTTTGKALLSHIIAICNNLPCPECASHASSYMQKLNMNNIQSKEDLIKMLFVFHNQVNTRIGQTEFEISELNAKYESANLKNVYNHFIRHFSDKHHVIQLIAHDIYRQRLCKQLTEWLSTHINDFEA